ncbi:hypothetical protein J6590_094752 [Homalodisca vitripennis]|nr:hypothetical protein J6590_094752 [Homalodisca vitripennis]
MDDVGYSVTEASNVDCSVTEASGMDVGYSVTEASYTDFDCSVTEASGMDVGYSFTEASKLGQDQTSPGSYRPILLNSSLCKIPERMGLISTRPLQYSVTESSNTDVDCTVTEALGMDVGYSVTEA